jgi:hypothetical protein
MPAVLSAIVTRRLARVGGTSRNVNPVAGTHSNMPNCVALPELGTLGRRSQHPHKRGQLLRFQHRPFVTSDAVPVWCPSVDRQSNGDRYASEWRVS